MLPEAGQKELLFVRSVRKINQKNFLTGRKEKELEITISLLLEGMTEAQQENLNPRDRHREVIRHVRMVKKDMKRNR